MWKPVQPTDDSEPSDFSEHIAKCFFVIDFKRPEKTVRYIGHTGSQMGYRSFFYIQPETRTAVIWAVNTSRVGAERKMLRAQRIKLFNTLFPLFGA